MPRIFDNIDQSLLPALIDTIKVSNRSDFCVGFFNLRGWKQIDSYIEQWGGGDGKCCRLLVGMQKLPQDELREALSLLENGQNIDNQTVIRLKRRLAEEFREQLTYGSPTNEDEAGLRRLAKQIRTKKVVVKLFLRYQLHAKLYLLFRQDPNNPITGYLGSSNLTMAGLSRQGELNIDVLDHDATEKLARWFEERWNDRWCIDISEELASIIEESWAREELIPPYHIYVKMAYHLAQEAIAGQSEFRLPKIFQGKLFDFQTVAVKIAAHHVTKRDGVLIGDVVGLGKTLMATALACVLEERHGWSTLIICPKNLTRMWQSHVDEYGLRARVLSMSLVQKEINNIPGRFRIVLIDESHNLRNSESKRYAVIRDYIHLLGCKCILLSATPYNKTYFDLANQLKLFVPNDRDLGIRPEQLIKRNFNGIESGFYAKYTPFVRSLPAFERSEYLEDWRELMRLFMVRRTRGYILDNYAKVDQEHRRKYLEFPSGKRQYFPARLPQTVKFKIEDKNPKDQYAKLYADDVVLKINSLSVPRYGLGNYIKPTADRPPTQEEAKTLDGLSRAGKRLMGFCRTNLFKRLESSGYSFLLSIERHILRNYIFIHAIENNKPIPVGTQDAGLLDSRYSDKDVEESTASMFEDNDDGEEKESITGLLTEEELQKKAADIYHEYETIYKTRFKWLKSDLFINRLAEDLKKDSIALSSILRSTGEWKADEDKKLAELKALIGKKHKDDKVLVFTQFADTVKYLEIQLKSLKIEALQGVTGDSSDPTLVAWRFSPVSNEKRGIIKPEDELRVLIATDVLSEGQNLQDGAIVVNYDLPWAIIRLVQRAGRVDRIGQQSDTIHCYSFLPAEGVERIIRLRARVRQRLQENAEIVGTDESFFEDDRNDQSLRDLFTEKSGILDGEADDEVDLASYAFQIWKNAIEKDSTLEKIIPDLPSVVHSTKRHELPHNQPEGALVYLKTAGGNNALSWIDKEKNLYSDSQLDILKAAECKPTTPALARAPYHFDLIRKAVELTAEEERAAGGTLGRPTGAKYKTFERLKAYLASIEGTLFDTHELQKAVDNLYRYPLRQNATDILNRQLKFGISDPDLAKLVLSLHNEDRLSMRSEEKDFNEPEIICSMGLRK
ncbi:MAG: helicase-related protein [Bacteroidota bacterium]